MQIKKIIKEQLEKLPVSRDWLWGRNLYRFYNNEYKSARKEFLCRNWRHLRIIPVFKKKVRQIEKILNVVDIVPVQSDYFFYSIDPFKRLNLDYHILDNLSIDYMLVVKGSLKERRDLLKELQKKNPENSFYSDEIAFIDTLRDYVRKCRSIDGVEKKFAKQLCAIESIFERPANSFWEALQRILFINQVFWQTRHKHNGLGHLDWILIDLYRQGIWDGSLFEDEAMALIEDFFGVLHENYWFKSTMLLGDTGQIIILGGLTEDGIYNANELTYKFIEISKKMKLPDPKVLLRYSSKMPVDLIKLALECMATGIGAPFLSNDDVIIPRLIQYGYGSKVSYNYAAAACWEPLILGDSCDQNNICSFNFAQPFVKMLDCENVSEFHSLEEILAKYEVYLSCYLKKILTELSELEFEVDPLISLFSDVSIQRGLDICRGGAKYCNLGLTSVGISTVINSLINIEDLVFNKKQFVLSELNEFRKQNFVGKEEVVVILRSVDRFYGKDDPLVIELTRCIQCMAEAEFAKHQTKYGGKFKFGLSSPNYITDAKKTDATFDGRKAGEPFTVHISSNRGVSVTELLSFAMQLDYSGCKLNGNVVDMIVTPKALLDNIQKYMMLLRYAFDGGVYQIQINVVDSKTLLEAKEHPELFPNLVVRVWGFSAFFNDLPLEYKNLLIERAIASEKVT